MYCPRCGHGNPADMRLCASCGLPLASAIGPSGAGDLPPRDLGELLRETMRLYRLSFWPFVFIALVPQLPAVLVTVISYRGTFDLAFALASLFLSIAASGATVYGVAQKQLGRPVHVRACLRQAWRRIVVLTAVFILYGLALLGSAVLVLLLIGIPILFYVAVVWAFSNEVIMIERRGVGALARSADLVTGSWWRVFGISAAFVLLALGGTGVISAVSSVVGISSPLLGDLLFVAVGTLLTPVIFIARTLLYFDLRVRKEDYSLHVLAQEVGG